MTHRIPYLYFGSYGPRYSDPLGTFCGLTREAVEGAVERALDYERGELPGYCDRDHSRAEYGPDGREEDCSLCNPDIVSFGIWAESRPIKDGFLKDFRELLAVSRELLESNRYGFGHVVTLDH